MEEQTQDDQLEPIYNSSMSIQDVALKTCREQWTIETGGERGSGRSVLAVRHDDDDDDDDDDETVKGLLKIDPVSHPARAEGVG